MSTSPSNTKSLLATHRAQWTLLVNSRHVATVLAWSRFAGQNRARGRPPLVPAAEWVCHVHALPVPWPEPDPQIAAAINAMYGSRKTERPLAVEVRDRLGQWLADEDFAAASGVRGRPGWSPSRLALVAILQRAGNLGDRQAAEAARARTDWQYMPGLPLDDPGWPGQRAGWR